MVDDFAVIVDIKGAKDIDRVLKGLANMGVSRVMKTASRSGAKVIVDQAKSNVATDDGKLRKAIFAQVRSVQNNTFRVTVGIDFKKAPHGHLVEFGTKGRREAKGRRGRTTNRPPVLIDRKTGKVFGKSVASMPARPFMRPAFFTTADKVVVVFSKGIWRAVDKEILRKRNLKPSR